MATNALTGLRDLFLPVDRDTVVTGTIQSVNNGQYEVLTDNGATRTCWGTGFKIGDTVLVRGNQVLGTVLAQTEIVVYIE